MKYIERGVVVISLGQDERAIKLVKNLRNKNILSELWSGKGVSKALEYTNAYNMPYVIFIGEEEVKKGKVKLRNMVSGKEELLDERDIEKKI